MSYFTKQQTRKNVVFAGLQIVLSGISLFVLYKILLVQIGVELIGVWSIVMAFSAFLRTGDFGFAGSIVKFVSENITKNDMQKVKKIISTSITSVSVILGFLLVISYFVIPRFLPSFISKEYIGLALELFPYSLVSVWLAVLGTLVVFVFDGINRVDIRSSFLVLSNLLLVILSILFVYSFGFIGLGYAQVSQALIQLIVAWILVNKYLKIDFLSTFSFDFGLFREMFSYSVHLQLASLMAMLLEPISKLFLGYFGTMSSVGYFEMANRLVMQIRNIIVNANQALVPMLTKAHTQNENLKDTYVLTLKILFIVSLCFYSFIGFLTSFISEIWVGYYENHFVFFTYVILISLGINTLAGAAYFTNVGTGNVRFNTISQVILAISNIIFGVILGYFFKDYGVVIAYGLSIIFGTLWLIINFAIRMKKKEI